jgi:hypothetical protein
MKIVNKELTKRTGRPFAYPFDDLEAGKAIDVGRFTRSRQISAKQSAKRWAISKGINPEYFTTRRENGKLFLYRTA